MDGDEVSYETLQDMLRNEKRSNRLTPVADGFWRALQHFLQDIESEFLREQGKDPFSRKASMLRDRVVHAQQAADGVWTLRERKIALLALAHVKEGGEPKGLTSKEKLLYNGLLDLLKTTRNGVFAGTAAEAVAKAIPTTRPRSAKELEVEAMAAQSKTVDDDAVSDPAPEADDVRDESDAPDVPAPAPRVPSDTPNDGQVTIEAIGDIPPFVGPDMQTYILKAGDMATVPENIAALLVKRNKAKIVQTV